MKKRDEEAFKIKNANLGLFVMHLQTTDLAQIEALLAKRVTQSPAFFSGVAMAVALGGIADAELDYPGLITLMRKQGIGAAGVIGGSESQRKAAMAAGLGGFLEAPSKAAAKDLPSAPKTEAGAAGDAPNDTSRPSPRGDSAQAQLPGMEAASEPTSEPASVGAAETPPSATSVEEPAPSGPQTKAESAPQRNTVFVEKPVRTGQRIYAEGADLVVLATVNAGAELIADGDIHVYAPLRGRALAGARGNTASRIFVMTMEAELVAIAGIFQLFEDGIPAALRGKPTQVSLEGERVTLQALTSSGR